MTRDISKDKSPAPLATASSDPAEETRFRSTFGSDIPTDRPLAASSPERAVAGQPFLPGQSLGWPSVRDDARRAVAHWIATG